MLRGIAAEGDSLPWKMISEVVPFGELKAPRAPIHNQEEAVGTRRYVVDELCRPRECLLCGEWCSMAQNTRQRCRRHPGVFLSLGPWEQRWTCCGGTHEEAPPCQSRRHTFHTEHGLTSFRQSEEYRPPGAFLNGYGLTIDPRAVSCWLVCKEGREEPPKRWPTMHVDQRDVRTPLQRPLHLHRRQASRRERRAKLAARHDAVGWLRELDLVPGDEDGVPEHAGLTMDIAHPFLTY